MGQWLHCPVLFFNSRRVFPFIAFRWDFCTSDNQADMFLFVVGLRKKVPTQLPPPQLSKCQVVNKRSLAKDFLGLHL